MGSTIRQHKTRDQIFHTFIYAPTALCADMLISTAITAKRAVVTNSSSVLSRISEDPEEQPMKRFGTAWLA